MKIRLRDDCPYEKMVIMRKPQDPLVVVKGQEYEVSDDFYVQKELEIVGAKETVEPEKKPTEIKSTPILRIKLRKAGKKPKKKLRRSRKN